MYISQLNACQKCDIAPCVCALILSDHDAEGAASHDDTHRNIIAHAVKAYTFPNSETKKYLYLVPYSGVALIVQVLPDRIDFIDHFPSMSLAEHAVSVNYPELIG